MSEDGERQHGRGHCGKGRGGRHGGFGGHHFEQMREDMTNNRELFDRNLTKLSPEAQKYAIQIREILEDKSKDGGQVREEIHGIKSGVPQEIRDELDDHKHRMWREIRRERGEVEGEGRRRSRSRPRHNN